MINNKMLDIAKKIEFEKKSLNILTNSQPKIYWWCDLLYYVRHFQSPKIAREQVAALDPLAAQDPAAAQDPGTAQVSVAAVQNQIELLGHERKLT